MSDKKLGWRDLPIGGIIPAAGNADEFETGSWRTFIPLLDKEKCTNCFQCFLFCPESSILVRGEELAGIDYYHCKGCGFCAEACPDKTQAIVMKVESDLTAEEKKQVADTSVRHKKEVNRG